MITLPSGSILVQKVSNNDFMDTKLESDLIPISVTGLPYILANISGANLQEVVDDIVNTLNTNSGGSLTSYSGYAEERFIDTSEVAVISGNAVTAANAFTTSSVATYSGYAEERFIDTSEVAVISGNLVNLAGTQTVTGAKTFTNTLTFSGSVLPATSGTLSIGSASFPVQTVTANNLTSSPGQDLNLKTGSAGTLWSVSTDSIGVKSSISSSNSVGVIGLSTGDGSDNGRLEIRGYGTDGFPNPSTRGAAIYLNGNENTGSVSIIAGGAAGAGIGFTTSGTSRWTIDSSGNLISNGSKTLKSSSGTLFVEGGSGSTQGLVLQANFNGSSTGSRIWMNEADGFTRFVGCATSTVNFQFYNPTGLMSSTLVDIRANQVPGTGFNLLELNAWGNRTHYLRGDGQAYADGSWNGGGADYAEYFESTTGSGIAVGKVVVLSSNKIREYNVNTDSLSDIFGVIRPKAGASAVVGNHPLVWHRKWLRDDYGAYILSVSGQRQLNPEYDPEQEYVQREDRDEWCLVGLLGQVVIAHGQPVNPNWELLKPVTSGVTNLYFIK